MRTHENFMQAALQLARRGRGWTSPNPVVGALVVKNNKIAGRGWHQKFGGPHAEVLALQAAGPAARGATLYCTLEPCNHQGKTPPCVQAVLRAGIAKVVLGSLDPHPLAAGGLKALRAAGIQVGTGVCAEECRRLNAPFFKYVTTGLPLVSVKWAMSADGKIATRQRDSKWITGPQARALARRLRAEHDAVLVGIGTVLADSPRLNCRPADAGSGGRSFKQPWRVILDSQARTPLAAPLWQARGAGPVLVVCGSTAPKKRLAALRAKGAGIIQCGGAAERLPLKEVLAALGKRGILSVLAEGGSEVLGSLLDAGLADMAYVFIAPRILGGREGLTAVSGRGLARVGQARLWRAIQVRMVGADVLVSGALSKWEYERVCGCADNGKLNSGPGRIT